MIEKIKKAYLVQDEYYYTDEELVKKVNEIIDVVNNLEKQYQKLKLNIEE